MKFAETLTGVAATATSLTFEESEVTTDQAATIGCWFIHAPGQSPLWSRYILACIHLREMPGATQAIIDVPGSTHQVFLYALDPDKNPQMRDLKSWSALRPINFSMQLELPSDDKARELLGLAAQAICDGTLWAEPPLSGQREPWYTSLIRTAAHLRGEEHAP